jgi:DMSO/TMAO reductase YedYZ molybdopterin-dependent catalytic subunit
LIVAVAAAKGLRGTPSVERFIERYPGAVEAANSGRYAGLPLWVGAQHWAVPRLAGVPGAAAGQLPGSGADYRLRINGLVDNPVDLDLAQLRALPPHEQIIR